MLPDDTVPHDCPLDRLSEEDALLLFAFIETLASHLPLRTGAICHIAHMFLHMREAVRDAKDGDLERWRENIDAKGVHRAMEELAEFYAEGLRAKLAQQLQPFLMEAMGVERAETPEPERKEYRH